MQTVRDDRLILLPSPNFPPFLPWQCVRYECLSVQSKLKVLRTRHRLVTDVFEIVAVPPDSELELDLRAAVPSRRAMDARLVRAEVDLVFEHDEPRRYALGVVAEVVLPVEVPLEAGVVLEELVGLAQLVADVALVVFLVQVLVELDLCVGRSCEQVGV